MFDPIHSAHAGLCRRPLQACFAAVLTLGMPTATLAATLWTVDSCSEANSGSGSSGSLRYAAANAVSGDTIDMTALTCSSITLSSGAIVFGQDDITVKGPGKAALTVHGSDDRVFRHDGHGAFALNDLTVAHGYVHPSLGAEANGGCISSNGKVYLTRVGVNACRAAAVGAAAHGGGVYGRDVVFAKYSDISANVASGSGISSGGGGVFSYHDIVVGSSTISGNSAQGSSGGMGGGLRALLGNTTVVASTISGNFANFGGGIYARSGATSQSSTFTLVNSTVSGNVAGSVVGGAWTNAGTIEVKNSTVAFNTAGSAKNGFRYYAAGFNIDDTFAFYTDINHFAFKVTTLQSSVFSNNTSGTTTPVADDFGITRFSNWELVPISGEKSLVFGMANPWLALNIDVATTGVCPLLGPLRANGGPTRTHALLAGSPAIDHGNNTVPFATDQRGTPFVRVWGVAADIGAYEVQPDDALFSDGFDGPPTCP
ncbi:MAG: hypothetical protein KIS89_06560 [Dokdonella sp.]|nr:hypothetical protein [Dokdonella sp.]